MKRRAVPSKVLPLSTYEENFLLINKAEGESLNSETSFNGSSSEVSSEHINEFSEEMLDNPGEQQEAEEQAELVKSYKAPGLDDDFLGVYSPSAEILEPGNYLSNRSSNDLLFIACEAGDSDLLLLALEQGADLKAVNADGKTCLDIAIEFNHQNCVHLIKNIIDKPSV